MTQGWRVVLPEDYAKRFEEGQYGTNLVLWRPGVTCWTTVYGLKKGETPASTYEWIKRDASKEAVQTFEFCDTKPLRFGYLLHEKPNDAPERWALYTHTIGETGYVLMAIYFDNKEDVETAKKIWFSITETQD